MGAITAWPAPAPVDGADPGGRDRASGRCRRVLTRAASQSIPMLVRFSDEGAPEHQLLLRVGLVEPGGVVQNHLFADVRGTRVAVRGAVVWDPLLERFV